MAFQRIHVVVLKPTVRLLEHVFRYGVKSRVRLEIVNPNSLPLQQVRIEVTHPQAIAKLYTIEGQIEANGIGQPVLEDVRFRDTQGEVQDIIMILNYECGGQEQRDEYVLPVTLKRLMTSSFDVNH
ncbi:MAG: hypothetical protein ACYC0V_16800, partial [Armatimonadota bacterium]